MNQFKALRQKLARAPTPPAITRTPHSEKAVLARKASSREAPRVAPPLVREVLSSPGKPLAPPMRASLESRFGWDFSRVRIHDDAHASESARQVNAQAYTVGQNIVFAEGRYAPSSAQGAQLLAHELAHVVQQRFQGDGSLEISSPFSPEEVAAEAAAERILDGRRPPVLLAGRTFLARQTAAKVPTGEEEGEETKPKDVFAGVTVNEIVVDLGRNRVGFFTQAGVARGNITTDLKPGTYDLKPNVAKEEWVIEGQGVRVGLRFKVDLEGALPWTMSYPEHLPLIVGSAPPARKGGGQPAEGPADRLAILRILDEMTNIPGAPPGPPADIDAFESVHYEPSYKREHGGWSKWLTTYYKEAVPQDINFDSITKATPRLWEAKQNAINWMNEDTFAFIVQSFPAVYSIISITPLAAIPEGPTGGGFAARRTGGGFTARRTVVKPVTETAEEPPIGGAGRQIGEPPGAPPAKVKTAGRTEPGPPGSKAPSARALAEREAAASPGAPLPAAQQEMANSLVGEHPELQSAVAEDAVKGAASVAGKSVKGADVRLLNGGGREVSVHTGKLDNLGNHLVDEALQENTTEIYVQINTSGVDRESVLKFIPSIRNAYTALRGKFVKLFGPDGSVWWSGKFGGPQ